MNRTIRKNVTTACQACRDSKTKCDGVGPQCSSCIKRGKDCSYEAKEDKRKLNLKPALAILRNRVQDLHEALLSAGSMFVAMDEKDEQLVNKVLESIGLRSMPFHDTAASADSTCTGTVAANAATKMDHSGILEQPRQDQLELQLEAQLTSNDNTDVNPALLNDVMPYDEWSQINWNDGDSISPDWLWAGMPTLEEVIHSPLPQHENSETQSKPLNKSHGVDSKAISNDDSTHEDDVDPGIVNQIAARFGSLRPTSDGKLRYYGAPANFHLFPNIHALGHSTSPRTVEIDGLCLLKNADLDRNPDPAFEHHLIKVFFSWHNSCNPIIDETVFWKARQRAGDSNGSDDFYSEVLTNAICSIAADYEFRYHPKLVTFPRTLAEYFAQRARTLLEIELDNPRVSTVQALLLLSSHEVGIHRIARSWLYSGMAMRLCFDLGLHVNTAPYVEQGMMSVVESQARQLTFWGCYLTNYRSSFSLGRPFTLNALEITLKKPTDSPGTLQKFWQPYPIQPGKQSEGIGPPTNGLPDLTNIISETRINLYGLMEPIVKALYGDISIPNAPLQELSEKATTAMFRWKENLADMLGFQDDSDCGKTPQMIVLLLEYHYLQILVHRPWTSHRLQPVPKRGPGYHHARRVCIDSACEMGRLLVEFERFFGFRRLNVETLQILPSAGLVLVFASVSKENAENHDISVHLNTVFRALDGLSNIYACAKDHLDGLLTIQRDWRSIYHRQQQGIKRRPENPLEQDISGHSAKSSRMRH